MNATLQGYLWAGSGLRELVDPLSIVSNMRALSLYRTVFLASFGNGDIRHRTRARQSRPYPATRRPYPVTRHLDIVPFRIVNQILQKISILQEMFSASIQISMVDRPITNFSNRIRLHLQGSPDIANIPVLVADGFHVL
jgi:hypothetical protein